ALGAAALADARGQSATSGECWRLALRNAPTLALVGAVAPAACWLATGAGIIGALFPMTAWMVARCAAVDEDARFLDALRRSASLTRGHRSRCARLWGLLVLVWAFGVLNVYFGVQGILSLMNMLLGVETSRW